MTGPENHDREPKQGTSSAGSGESPDRARRGAGELDSAASEALEARLLGEPLSGIDPDVRAHADAMARAREVLGDDADAPDEATFEALLREAVDSGAADHDGEPPDEQIGSVPTPLHSPRPSTRRGIAVAAAAAVVVVLGGIGVMSLDRGTSTASSGANSSETESSDAAVAPDRGVEESEAGEPGAAAQGEDSGTLDRSQPPGPRDSDGAGNLSGSNEEAESVDAASAPPPQAATSSLSGLEFTIVVPITGP